LNRKSNDKKDKIRETESKSNINLSQLKTDIKNTKSPQDIKPISEEYIKKIMDTEYSHKTEALGTLIGTLVEEIVNTKELFNNFAKKDGEKDIYNKLHEEIN